MLVLDEANRMQELGFEVLIQKILDKVRPDRQMVVLLSEEIGSITAMDWMKNPLKVTVGRFSAS